jgi:ABC-type phosphate transport system permease subunit
MTMGIAAIILILAAIYFEIHRTRIKDQTRRVVDVITEIGIAIVFGVSGIALVVQVLRQ